MKNKKDKLQFFSESLTERIQIEVNRVSQLYKADRIGGIRGHEMLHQATRDINKVFWQVSTMIGKEHQKIDYLHKVKRSMADPLNSQQYFSKPTLESLENLVKESKLFRSGLSDYGLLRKAGILARRLVRIDSIVLRQDIADLLHKAKRSPVERPMMKADMVLSEDPILDKQMKDNASGYLGSDTILPSEQEIQAFADMEVKKIPKS